MKVNIEMEKIKPMNTSTEPNIYRCRLVATGSEREVEDYYNRILSIYPDKKIETLFTKD